MRQPPPDFIPVSSSSFHGRLHAPPLELGSQSCPPCGRQNGRIKTECFSCTPTSHVADSELGEYLLCVRIPFCIHPYVFFCFNDSFLAVLDFCCCVGFFLVAVSRGYSLAAVLELLIVVVSLVAGHWLQGTQASVVVMLRLNSCSSQVLEHRLNSCCAWAQLLCSMWDLPRPGIKPLSPALAGRIIYH